MAVDESLMQRLGLFRCEPLSATLKRETCGKRWLYALNINKEKERNQAEMSYNSCMECPVGKKHAQQVTAKDIDPNRDGKGAWAPNNLEYLRTRVKKTFCPQCGVHKPNRNKYCSKECSSKSRGKIKWDDYDLVTLCKEKGASQLARELGVTEAVVRKHRKRQLQRT